MALGDPAGRRLRSLSVRHRRLDKEVTTETKRPRPDVDLLQRLKKQKLALKDQIRDLQRGTARA